MGYNEVVQLIGAVGFPIVACGGLFWMINTTMKELTGAINNLNHSIMMLVNGMKESA